MEFNYKQSSAMLSITAFFLLSNSFHKPVSSSITVSDFIRSMRQPLSSEVAWVSLPLPDPPGDQRHGGSRDGLLCFITHGSHNNVLEIWHDNPHFVWAEKFLEPGIHGSVDRVVVVHSDSQTIVWDQTMATAGESVAADSSVASLWSLSQMDDDDAALQPGQTYKWIALNRHNQELETGAFRVVESATRETIRADLAALEDTLKDQDATEEDIAFAKAAYFTERKMWSDALQVIYSVEEPSQSLMEFRGRIPDRICEGSFN